MLINKARYSLRFFASMPIYSISILIWVYIAKTILKSAVLVFSVYLSPYRFGQVLGIWLICIVAAALSAGLWMLGRYVRTSSFRKPPKPATTDLP
jgi:hypothetical protein